MAIWSPELAATLVLVPAFLLLRTKDTETQQVAFIFTATQELVEVFSQILKCAIALGSLKASFPSRNTLRGDTKILLLGTKEEMMVK